MSYIVEQVPLAPITGVHEGTGTHQATIWSVDPTNVPGSGPMAFTGYSGEVTTMLFAISDNVVPASLQKYISARLQHDDNVA